MNRKKYRKSGVPRKVNVLTIVLVIEGGEVKNEVLADIMTVKGEGMISAIRLSQR